VGGKRGEASLKTDRSAPRSEASVLEVAAELMSNAEELGLDARERHKLPQDKRSTTQATTRTGVETKRRGSQRRWCMQVVYAGKSLC
jgi:hypothetical protein